MAIINKLIDRLSEEKRALYDAFVESNSDIAAQFQYLQYLLSHEDVN